MVSIAAFQAVDPGSIPGRRNFFSIYNQMCKGSCVKFMNSLVNVPRGLTARISGFHPEVRGSASGVGNFCLLKKGLKTGRESNPDQLLGRQLC